MKAKMTRMPVEVNHSNGHRFNARAAGLPVQWPGEEAFVQGLARELGGKKARTWEPWNREFGWGGFSVRSLGRCSMGRLIAVEFPDGPEIAFLLDQVGYAVAISLADEGRHIYKSGVRYSAAGEIVEMDMETLGKLRNSGMNHLCTLMSKHGHRHGLESLHPSAYRSDWHDNTPKTLRSAEKQTLRILDGRGRKAA